MSSLRIFLRSFAIVAVLAALMSGTAFAQSITGVVTNKTNDRPSSGDDVVLLKLAQGMQELARAKSDSRGRFTIKVPPGEADGIHMIRVTHEKANYFRTVQPGTQSVEVEVYDAAAQVEGVSIAEDVMQVQTEPGGQSLRVVEHFLVKNASEPAKTLFSEHPFELTLPEGAVVEGAAAKAPGGMAVTSQPVPEGPPGKFAIIFPIRPGDTEFHVWYHVPYTGSYTFKPKPSMETANLAVMLPKSMGFKQGTPANYQSVTEDVGVSAQAFVAQNAKPSEPLEFTVSGTGELPRDANTAQSSGAGASGAAAGGAAAEAAVPDSRPGGGLGVPVDKDAERDPLTKYRLWIIGGVGLLMVVGAAFMMNSRPRSAVQAAAAQPRIAASLPSAAGGGGSLQVLRDEMFAVETDRLEGRLSDSEYAQLKAAFDVVLRRALARSGTQQVVTE